MQEIFSRLRAEHPGAAAQASAIGGALRYGLRAAWFSDPQACFRAMLEDLRGAERSIWLRCGVIEPGVMWETVLTVLRQKAARGVDVRLVCGRLGRLPPDFAKRLALMRIRCRMGWGAHRGLSLIVDGALSYFGAMDIRDRMIGLRCRSAETRAGMLRLRGSAAELLLARFAPFFPDLPEMQTGTPVADYGYASVFSNGSAAIDGMIRRAEHSLRLLTPRLLPGRTLNALRFAAASGIDVAVLAGDALPCRDIRIARFPGRIRGVACCADGQTAAVAAGREGIWLHGSNAAAAIESDLDHLISRCEPGLTAPVRGHTPGRTGGIDDGQGDFQTGDRGASARCEAL